MAQSKKKWVAFKGNVMVPGSILGEVKDQKMQAGEPVLLQDAYADHVVQDGFAVFCDAPKKGAPKKSGSDKAADDKGGAADAAKLEAAQARVDDLTAKMAEMSEGEEGWNELAIDLAAAEADRAALQPAS